MKLRLLFVLLAFQVSFAQQHRTCGMQEQMQRIMNDPALRQAYLDQQSKFETELQSLESNKNGNSTNAVIRIPVAVHFPAVSTSAAAALKTCLRGLAQTQVNILNADYNAQNADISNYAADASYYPGTNTGSLQVQFVLATQNHPAGTGLVNGDLAVTFGTDFLGSNDSDTTWSGYLNLVCRNAGSGILGYSPLGGSPSAGNCVVIAKTAFGSGVGCTGYVPGSPYDLGRTLTHELGHYFNLDHTFAGCDGANCATSGDRVCDTPALDTENYDCPAAGDVMGCTTYALTMNYMDYVNDACMYMFTAGQAARMLAWYNSISSQFTTTALANDAFLQAQFNIYPNPSKGSFNIAFKDFSTSYSVEVFDVTGKTIYENNFDQSSDLVQSINLDHPSSGVYFINVKSDRGIVTKKLVVE
ncbi:MAG TPA: zinc-dependent metalloprotease [Flavobacterium sp.]|uniref:zinc-dependent metalloprotease n=1 Tax=Flavobacterium sp. TaxID=239 RepID=UPI002BA2A77F|nr:zinc-dependent metalloprotease [Flavobacterium sp.]HNP32170.1 zinc-dependent metalloprotease [Flavobacterium sp.]